MPCIKNCTRQSSFLKNGFMFLQINPLIVHVSFSVPGGGNTPSSLNQLINSPSSVEGVRVGKRFGYESQ